MNYPTIDQVSKASRYEICKWYRFLPSPTTESEAEINNFIFIKFKSFGGFTPELSKAIGWDNQN